METRTALTIYGKVPQILVMPKGTTPEEKMENRKKIFRAVNRTPGMPFPDSGGENTLWIPTAMVARLEEQGLAKGSVWEPVESRTW